MEMLNKLDNSRNLLKTLDINNELDIQINNVKSEFGEIVKNVIDKGANYIIKAMPINNNIKNVLLDVKKALKTKNFKDIINTAINSSIKEGLEILSLPKNVIKDITKIKDVAIKGGISSALSAGVEIVLKKYLKNNLYSDEIKDFISKIRDFLNNNAFIKKIDQGIKKSINRVNKFDDLCQSWYKSYNEFNIDEINSISKKLNSLVNKVNFNDDSVKSNNIIQNLTKFINSKKDKLSSIQYKTCSLI